MVDKHLVVHSTEKKASFYREVITYTMYEADLPTHVPPTKVYPGLQRQKKLPKVFRQVASGPQGPLLLPRSSSKHSLMSVKLTNSNN